MSACNYSEKYLPLIEKWKQEGTFETNVKNFFVPEDAEKLLNSMGMDRIGSIPVRSMEVKDVTFNKGVEVNQDSINVVQYYIGNDSQYRKMNTRFKRAMVETAIYNPNNGGSLINANELNGDISFLNEGIIKYKKSLLKSIALFLNEDIGNIDTYSYDALNDLQKTLLSKYRAQMSENDNTDVYDAYVILSNFDQMLKNFAPYITVVYSNSNQYHPKRYQYEGPSVKHYTGVMSNDEYASAEDNASDIAKILLEYFSEVDENGNDIEGAPIGIKGFNSAMTKVYTWAKDDGRISGNTVTDSNTLYNIIEDYLNLYATKNLPLLHRTYLTSKLRGIQKYIYGGKIEADLVLSLTHQLEKTMPSNYIEYNIALTGATDLRYLTERPVLLQKTMLKECMHTAIDYWKHNPNTFKDVLEGIEVKQLNSHTYIISFNGVEVQVNSDGTITIPNNSAIANFESIIENISQLYVDPDIERIANQIYTKSSLIDLYMPIIAPIILRAKGHDVKINDGKINDLGRVLSIMYGSDVLNVVKNGAGNSLPLYQMLCLAYRHKDIHERIEKQGNTIYNDNIIYNNINNVLNPQIRSGVIHDGKFKSAAELTTDEVIHIAILYDFYKNLTSGQTIQEGINKRSGIIGLQSHVYSDKNKHFVQMFDLNKSWKYKDENEELIQIIPAEILRNYIDGKSDNLDSLITAIWQSQKWQLNSLVSQILSDYRKVFKNETFGTLADIKAKISKYKNIDELREAFVAAGIEFKEEIHASKVSGKWSINESLVYLLKQFDSFETTKKFITEIQFERFKSDASKAIDTIKKELTATGDSVDVDRMLFAYFITDILFTNNYNQMMVGQVFAHPNKNNRKIDNIKSDLRNTIYKGNKDVTDAQLTAEAQGIFESESFASRWIGQVKRMVIYGATYHSYAQGLDDGVSEFVKTAVIEDIPVETFSITGLYKDDNDSMDGSGFTHPIFSRLQNRSLLDAAVGANKKTIYHDIDGRYGTPTLLKWAEYEITNEKRRNSHSVSLEKIYKKMSSFAIDNNVNVEISPDNLYYRDQKTGNHYRIDYIAIENGVGTIIRTKVNENGVEIRNEDENGNLDYDTEISMPITTIYDIDQLLGGAWAETLTDDRLEFTETNLDLLTKIVCDNKLKDYMIGWLVNKSGMKVGWSNLNTKSAWTDDKPLRYTTLSTRFGGLQMNADHELDQAEVTEMTQVISALEQMGVMHDVVSNIYREIGSVCYDSIKDVIQASETDLEKLYQIYGKAIIESFNSGTKDTLGLAQSFCALAQKSLQDNKITYRIPFSSSSINGIFNSTVTSQLIRKAIRRHYSGVAAVLNPSYNIIEYYSVGGMQYRKEELFDVIKERCIAIGAPSLMNYKSIDDFINDIQFEIGGRIYPNPFVEEVAADQIDFEDTVILIDENGNYTTPIKIDNLEKYHLVKTDSRRILRHTLRPKNLKGSNTTFIINNQTHSVYESPYTLALRYFVNNNKSGAVDSVSFKNELTTYFNEKYGNIFGDVTIQAEYISDTIINLINEFQINNPGIDAFKHINIFKKYLLKKQQNLLNALSEGKAFDWYGNQYIPKDVKVYAAQIGMGKKYAKEFGLRKGDSIAKIKKEGAGFFYRRIGEAFTNNWGTNAQYDHVLYDGNGEKIYVKVLDTEAERNAYKNPGNMTLVSNTDYVVIDGTIYHGSEELCSNEGKEIWAYEDERGRKFNLFIVNSYERLQELWNTHEYVHREDNYTEDNYEKLIEFTNQKRKNPIIPSQWNSIDELLAKLNNWENEAINKRKEKWAEEKYQTFLTSLQFVGARIPCQNMTSFAPMEVVIFSDVEENEIYLPSMVTWLEGADYDIDKTYLLGYSVDSKGRIHTEGESKKYASDILKNHVVSGMLSVITNPKTQINLTTPLSVENMQNLAAKSILGAAARRMTPYNSACKYMMQIENMVGKNVIGNVATAIKSFFALNYVYNEAFNNIFKALANGDFTTAQELLNKYSFKDSFGKYRTLANVNMDAFDNIDWNALPENIKIPLLEIYNWQAGLDDQSLMLAELLNVATDNAKELILKKINADTNWVDIYTSAFVLGEDLNTIGSFMISPEISELISKYSSSIFDPDASFETKIQFIEKNISEADTPAKKYAYTELLERVKIAEELRILGKILKINQGMPTNTSDFYEYIGKIEYFVESRLNSKNISAALSFSKSQKQFTEVSGLFIEFLDVINEILNNDTTEESIKKHQNKINSFLKAVKLSPDNFKILREYYQKSKGRFDINAKEYQKLPEQIQDILNINVDEDGKLDFKNCTNFVNSLNAIYEIMTLPGKNIDNGHKQIFEKLKSDFWGFVQKCFDSESSYFSWVYNITESSNKTSNKLWANLQNSWKKFDLVQFVKNKEYAQSMILEYENVKVKFNILDTLISLPHFNEMYKVLALNDRVLTVLSKRNKIESEVWRRAIHKKKDKASALMNTPNKSERKVLKSLVDDALIQTWLTTGFTDFYLNSPDGTRLDFDGSLNISKLKLFIETSIIPRLRNNKFIINGQNIDTKSNEFVRRLTFGKHNGESIFKLPFNMSEIDSNPGIKQEYEKILQAFGELRNIHLEGGLTVVDVFYLYNLIVHKDHFGRNSLTRLFEDLISSKDGEKLLVFKFNEWLETVNEQEIVGKVLSSWGASHRNDLSSSGNSTQIYISTNPLNKSIPFYSGGAPGSDSAWGMYLRQQGFAVKDFTVNDWDNLSSEQKAYYEQLYQTTVTLMQESGWPEDTYAGKLTRRDMMQADSATSIFAIGTLSKTGKVNGGTRYATYAAISQGKPVYLFNLNNNSWYWYDYNSKSFIKMTDKPNLISGAAVIGTRDDKSIKSGATGLRASGHEAIKDIIDRSLKLSNPTTKSKTVKYTPKGQPEQTYTIIGNKIFNRKGEEVYANEDNGHRQLIFVELALQENRAVKVEYRNVTYIVNDRNQIFSTSSNKIVYQNENDGNRRVILERAKEEFAKLKNSSKMIDINTISPKTESFGVVFPKQEKTSQALKSEYKQWQIDNPTGIVAYRVKFPYNTVEEVQLGHIGNPFSENARGANTVQQFYDWLVTGNNFGNKKATDEYRRAIISKLLSTPANSPILYYTELNRPSHATVLGYLIANKQLLSNQSSPRVEIYQGYWTRKEVESQTDKVFLFGDNTDDRVNTHYIPSRTQAVIRGLNNAIGIDTKKNRGTSENSYFTDADFDIFKVQVDEAIQRAIDSGKIIVIPADGIGTGKAELDKRAPKLFAYLQQKLDELKNLNFSSTVQLTLNFGENDDPERFNTVEESVAVLESPKTILSNSELQLWSHVTNPKILVASEHSDPAFHTKKILEVINGTRNVIDWKGNNFTGNQFDGLYIITKHDGLPIRKLLETKIPKLIHFSITTLGGTKYEPGVMKYNDLLDRIAEYIKLGLDPNTITIRIDPIVPGETKWEDIEVVMRRSAEMGIKRIKFSIMDAYPNTIKAMTELGYNFETYYETKTNLTVNGQYKFHAKESVQKDFATRMLQLAQKYNLELHTCAEPLVLPGILHEGCLSVNAVNEMLGTHIEDRGYDNNKSRQLCSCFGGKIDVLKYGDNCASHCIYCYAKHENDRAVQYYNEDGTLKHNAFTDIYWDDQYNIEDISEESVAEEPVTIGFDNTNESIDNETDFSITQDEVESILSIPKVIPNGQYKYIQSLAGKQFSSTEAAVIYYVLEIAKLDPNINFEIFSKINKAQQEILNGLNSEQIAELFEVATKDLKMSEWNKDLMTKLNLGMLELNRILTDIVADSLHIDSDYIAEREEILRNASRNSEGKLLAPNGKVSKLTEEQWVTVRTKAFKEWFGDWERVARSSRFIKAYARSLTSATHGNLTITEDLFDPDMMPDGASRAIILNDEYIGNIPVINYENKIQISGSFGAASEIEKEYRGRGYGIKSYIILANIAKAEGKTLYSDSSLSDDAIRLWESLVKKGYAEIVKENKGKYSGFNSVQYRMINENLPNVDSIFYGDENVSKVIDLETGEPKVVYHHTDNSNLTEFSTDFPNYFSKFKNGTKKAIFFDENLSGTLSRKYDIPVFLNIKNLTTYVGTKEDLHKKGTDYTTIVNESAARDARFGGLHMSKFDDNKLINQEVWIIHDEHNVKSATGAHEFTSSPNIYDADPTPVYQTIPSKQSKLIELVRQANEKGVKGIHIVSQSDLINEDIYIRSANGFVRNGEIYINVDRAGDDTVIHEFGHLYLADAKVNNREKYYELLEKVRQTKLWSDMKTWKAYANKIGSDFDEEVLATMIGDYYKSEFGTDYEYTDLVKEALSLVDGGFIDLINSEILPDLGDTFITNYALSQRTATLKHKLVSDNILKENCL